MTSQTLKKPEIRQAPTSEKAEAALPEKNFSPASGSRNMTFDNKAEEMKIFLSHNPIPEVFLKKK